MENLLVGGQRASQVVLAIKEPDCQCKRHKRCESDPWVGKIPWRRAQQPTPVLLPGEPTDRGAWQATVHGVPKSWTRLSTHTDLPISEVCSAPEQLQ